MPNHYQNTEIKHTPAGEKIVRKVYIKNGKGYKSVTMYRNGRKLRTAKKPIHTSHVDLIVIGKFIPGLFSDCKCKPIKNKTRKYRKLFVTPLHILNP